MFEPRGEKPQWQVIYDRISQMEIGDVVTHQELRALLPTVSKTAIYALLGKANGVLLIDRKRMVENVRGVGYRMIEADRHVDHAKKRRKRARVQVRKGMDAVVGTDVSLLSPDQRRRNDEMEFHLRKLYDFTGNLDRRTTKLEARTAVNEKDSAKLADELDAVKEKLRRHGIE